VSYYDPTGYSKCDASSESSNNLPPWGYNGAPPVSPPAPLPPWFVSAYTGNDSIDSTMTIANIAENILLCFSDFT
jgi:hypothetical protein